MSGGAEPRECAGDAPEQALLQLADARLYKAKSRGELRSP